MHGVRRRVSLQWVQKGQDDPGVFWVTCNHRSVQETGAEMVSCLASGGSRRQAAGKGAGWTVDCRADPGSQRAGRVLASKLLGFTGGLIGDRGQGGVPSFAAFSLPRRQIPAIRIPMPEGCGLLRRRMARYRGAGSRRTASRHHRYHAPKQDQTAPMVWTIVDPMATDRPCSVMPVSRTVCLPRRVAFFCGQAATGRQQL